MLKKIKYKIKYYLINIKINKLKKNGLVCGKNLKIEKNVDIDKGFSYLIEIGENVTIAPNTVILAHDASTKTFLDYTKIGKVKIGNNVFIGANCIILPNVKIGDNVIIGAGTVVTKNIESNCVVCGNPAKKISSTTDYIKKNKALFSDDITFDESFTFKNISKDKKDFIKDKIDSKIGFVK